MAQSTAHALPDLRGLSGSDVDRAFQRLQSMLTRGAQESRLVLLAPGAPKDGLSAYWRVAERYWVTFEYREAMRRHLCSYGVVNPAKEQKQTMVCQINVQAIEPWNLMAAFATDGRNTYYVHNGQLARRSNFATRYRGPRAYVQWDGRPPVVYFVVAKLGDARTAADVGTYVQAIARFKSGDALEDTRTDFETGLAETIQELETRIGGADRSAAGTVEAGGNSGSLVAATEKLEFLKKLQEQLRYDPFLLTGPVDKITESVLADRRRRFRYSVGAAILSIVAGWLLSGISPSNVMGLFQGVYTATSTILPWLPH